MPNDISAKSQERPLATVEHAAAEKFTPSPIPAEDILEGLPEVFTGPIWVSEDGTKMAGVSRMTPGRYRYHSTYHEAAVVLRGHLRVTGEDGTIQDARPGDVVHMQPGARAELTVVEDFEDYYIISSADGAITD